MGSGFPKVSLLEWQSQSPRHSLGLLEETWLPFSAGTRQTVSTDGVWGVVRGWCD